MYTSCNPNIFKYAQVTVAYLFSSVISPTLSVTRAFGILSVLLPGVNKRPDRTRRFNPTRYSPASDTRSNTSHPHSLSQPHPLLSGLPPDPESTCWKRSFTFDWWRSWVPHMRQLSAAQLSIYVYTRRPAPIIYHSITFLCF